MLETLSWPRVESRLENGTPWTLSMGGGRGVRIGFAPADRRLYVRLPAADDLILPATAYKELELRLLPDGAGRVLEISTESRRYFREFHRFASLLTETFEQADLTAADAFEAAIKGWQEFVSSKAILTPEQQLGLFGELLMLEGLVRQRGPTAVDAWISRETTIPERHDFRIGSQDFEIKTSRSTTRVHFVHGLQQLVSAAGHNLFILSLRLEAAGADGGRSLRGQVELLRELAGDNRVALGSLDRKLQAAQYRDEDEGFYRERLILADAPKLIPVDAACPRITSAILDDSLSADVARRIGQVAYQVNLEGLGSSQGSPGFASVLGDMIVAIS